MPEKPEQPTLGESALVWDYRSKKWIIAFRKDYKRQEAITFIDNVTFDNVTTTKTSDEFESAPYSNFLLLVDLAVTETPTNIVIDVEFSHDRVNWFKYMNGPFGDLRWEDSAGDKMESISGAVLAPWIRIKATATGTTAANKFTLTARAIFNG